MQEASRIIQAMDTDDDGIITRWEFLKYMMELAEDVSSNTGSLDIPDSTVTSQRKQSNGHDIEANEMKQPNQLTRRMSWYLSEAQNKPMKEDEDEDEEDFDE